MILVNHNNEMKEVIAIYVGNLSISSKYVKDILVFNGSILICFANGYWVDNYVWNDNSYWR